MEHDRRASGSSIHGDPRRDADHTIAGFAYQFVVASIAWLTLRPDQDLHLEIAEDYAQASLGILKGVQVKHTADPITSNTPSVIDAINSLFDLRSRNPDRDVSIVYLTTSPIGVERSLGDRVNGKATLLYWDEVAKGAEVAPLRARLRAMPLGLAAKAFVQTADDDALRNKLVRRVEWVSGAPGLDRQQKFLADLLVELGHGQNIPPSECEKVMDAVVLEVLNRSASPDLAERVVRRADLLRLFEARTRISVARGALDQLLTGAALSGGSPALARTAALSLVATPPIEELADRPELSSAIGDRIGHGALAWLVGPAGHGKSSAAIRAARSHGGRWGVLRLRGSQPAELKGLLRRATAEALVQELLGVVLDDLDAIDDRDVIAELHDICTALARRDKIVIVTSATRPALNVLRQCGARPEAILEVGRLSEDDAKQVVERLGGDAELWGRYVHLAGGFGHPQLVHALAIGLSMRGWPLAERRDLEAILGRDEALEEVQEETRRRLVRELPEASRDQLYRLVALLGLYDRQTALAIGRAAPAIERAGEAFDRLIGPWVERVGDDAYRTSPLLRGSDRKMLPEDTLTAIHAAAARDLAARRKLSVDRLDAIFTHGLLGHEPMALARLAMAVLNAAASDLPLLAEASTVLRHYTTINVQFPRPSPLHPMLRAAQVLLLAARHEGPAFQTAMKLFEEEVAVEPTEFTDRAPGADAARLLLWGRLLQIEGVVELLGDMPDRCLRTGQLVRRMGMDIGRIPSASGGVIEGVTAESFFFYHRMCHAETVAGLTRAVLALKGRSPQDRAALLGPLDREPFSATLAVRSPWMKLYRAGAKGTLELAEEYRRLASFLDAPDEEGLYVGAIDTAAVILDEDLDQANQALAIVEQALTKYPASVPLKRSLSRIYLHMGLHDDQLRVGLPLVGDPALGNVDLAYLHRELAIGLSHVSRHAESARLFRDGAKHAGAMPLGGMANMATGMIADAAVQHVCAGDGPAALAAFVEVLPVLDGDRGNHEFASVALRKLFGHSVMWARLQLIPAPAVSDAPSLTMIPGANSNPIKHPDLQEQPSGPFDATWYILADLEAHFAQDLGIVRSIESPSWDARAILPMEVSHRFARLREAVDREDAAGMEASLPGFIDASTLMQMFGPNALLGELSEFKHGRVPVLQDELFAKARGAYRKTPLSVFLRKAFNSEVDQAFAFLEAVATGRRSVFTNHEIAIIRNSDLARIDPPSDVAAAVQIALAIRSEGVPNLRALMVVTSRLVENEADPYAGGVLAVADERLLLWWRQALDRQAFRLKSPALARSAFDEAARAEVPARSKLARTLLALNPFLDLKLSADLQAELSQLRG
ncbi:hypothetical protein FHG66_12765 [Rubellimicrobium rubrum]|uniref:Uncharacterized protein n=1 Tax=Rubellimicrobium rubrum TaxID=2585369 RepID=A0A5C4MSN8_9RHOB|nr:hypothetical protein [Rubellimicrobium rubrum]TNC49028.1 hypothetical protein FHG66_12765 [Rubellimicrobium rubrum]